MLNWLHSRFAATETPDEFRERCIRDGVNNLKRTKKEIIENTEREENNGE